MRPLSRSVCLAALALSAAAACSSSSPDSDGEDTTNSGGTGSGGDTSSGGASGTGASSSTGGSATGGGNGGPVFTCPAGQTGLLPDLESKTATLLATAPDMNAGGSFIEGPVWREGSLYLSQLLQFGNQPEARILKLTGTTLAEHIPNAGTNGLAVNAAGHLIAASHKSFGIVDFDPNAVATAPVVIIDEYDADTSDAEPAVGFNSPNDLVLRSDGNIYFTDPSYQCGSNCPQGTDRVYRLSPEGVVSTVASTLSKPNGIALSPDENTLYVAGNGPLEKFPLDGTGVPGARVQFAATGDADGLGIDCAGNVYVTDINGHEIDVYKPNGELHGSIPVGVQVTNVAFGGPTNTTLYVTTYSQALHSVELDIPGFPY